MRANIMDGPNRTTTKGTGVVPPPLPARSVGFAAASLACGLAPSLGVLNATRAIQGIGAALMVPSSLAILNDACAHDSRLRARAIGIWTAAGGVALTAPIGAIIEARPLGLTHPIVAAGSLLALTAGAAFIAVETRTASPMLPLYFFRLPGCTPAIVFGVLINCTYYGIIFVLSLYLQKALGYSTVQAGLAFLPLTGTFIASNIASGWMAGRIGSRAPMILGGLIGAEPWSNL